MEFCGKCGTQVSDGVKFCPACGAETAAGAQAQPGTQPQQQQPGYGAQAQPGTQPQPQQQAYGASQQQQQQPGYGAGQQQAYGAGQQQQGYGAPPQYGAAQSAPGDWSDWASDARQNKVWGILAYILFLIPLLAAPKNSKFSRYHTNQGLSFFIFWLVIVIVLNIVQAIVVAAMFSGTAWLYGYGWGGLAIFGIIGTVVGILFAIIGIVGIVHAAKGEKKPLPLLGKINILKVEM
jgi:uncharacterized membrane protein